MLFKVKFLGGTYTVYAVRGDAEREDIKFLIYFQGEWKWMEAFLFSPLDE